MMPDRRFLRVLLTATLILTGCGLSTKPGPTPTPSDAAPKPRRIVIGMVTDLPGMSLFDPVSVKWSGFDADLVNWLADEPAQFVTAAVPLEVAEREYALQGNRVDIVVASYSITDGRRGSISFAGPYLLTRQGVMVRHGDNRIKDLADLTHQEVCTTKGSTSSEQLKGRQVDLTEEVGTQKCVDRLLDGQVDAVSIDQLILYGFAQKYPGKVSVIPHLTFGKQEEYGIGLPRGDMKMCEEMTQKIRRLIVEGDWDNHFRNNFGANLDRNAFKPKPDKLDPCQV